jgi:pimeloyl-ACP methyl ester carboxylesterase
MVPGELWRPICEVVARFGRILCYDRANLGRSDPAPKPRTAADMADDLAAVLAGAGAEGPYVLVGASFGGLVVRLYAAGHPEQVAGMVLVDSTHPEQAAAFERLVPRSEGEPEDLRRLRAWVTTTDPDTHPEGILFEESLRQVREASLPGGLGDRPLVVLSRGLSIRYEFPTLAADVAARWMRPGWSCSAGRPGCRRAACTRWRRIAGTPSTPRNRSWWWRRSGGWWKMCGVGVRITKGAKRRERHERVDGRAWAGEGALEMGR